MSAPSSQRPTSPTASHEKNRSQVRIGNPAISSTQKITDSTGITGPNGTRNPRCRSGSGAQQIRRVFREGLNPAEIHIGRTRGPDTARPFLHTQAGPQGAMSTNGQIAGCYVHGLFQQGTARAAILQSLGTASTLTNHGAIVETALDEIAAVLAERLDIAGLAATAGLPAHLLEKIT